MNLELRKLGVEIINEIPKTWDFLKLVDARLIRNPETFETIGAFLYNNKHIFNEYLRYKYELGRGSYKSWMIRWDKDDISANFNILLDEVVAILMNQDGWWFDDSEPDTLFPSDVALQKFLKENKMCEEKLY